MNESDDGKPGNYSRQDRGSREAYESYFAGMDISMRQKVALTTAHFPVRGRIADMGCGSGLGTYELACLYRDLEMVGVDINPVSVERARREYRRENLAYEVGDISGMVFPAASLDGILNSSVLHHVTSFNGFDVGRVLQTLDNQVAQLKTGGVLIIRDFVIPDGPAELLLDVPTTDGTPDGNVAELSTAALFELFARDWRGSTNLAGPLAYAPSVSTRPGFARFRLTPRAAAEFVLRKDYRADWDTELLEEYTYLSQSGFEEAFRARGLRVVVSAPLWNPWIVRHRFEGRFHLSDMAGRALPFPPTNYLIVGEKVGAGRGVALIEEQSRAPRAPRFLTLTTHRRADTGEVFELAERPHRTLDLVPWCERDDRIIVFAKKSFPRPIINARTGSSRLDGASFSGYVTEPVSSIVDSSEPMDEAALRVLAERAGLTREEIVSLGEPFHYYTSPGGVNERVLARLVRIRPRDGEPVPFPNYTEFTDAGTVRGLDAHQVLRAGHVGGMLDARLEINVYRLLRQLGVGAGPWIGAAVELTMRDALHPDIADGTDALRPPARALFEPREIASSSVFLDVREGDFAERARDDANLARARYEYVLPKRLSANTLTALPVALTTTGLYIGVEQRDLPAPQAFGGSSTISTVPAWRLPLSVTHLDELGEYLADAMLRDFGVRVVRSWPLGGTYFPTPGVTPEIVHPFAAEVELDARSVPSLKFIRLDKLADKLDAIEDAHLLIILNRALHALGHAPA